MAKQTIEKIHLTDEQLKNLKQAFDKIKFKQDNIQLVLNNFFDGLKEEEEQNWDEVAKMFGAESNMQLLAQKKHIDINWVAGDVELIDDLPRNESLNTSGFNAEE
ncbi:TPA: hypothetical protein HA278_02390 [Candidatus Woesearchaeota archaeon]|nr:hypothetical protein [Candidatus Woesearchaeota archaeon]